VLYKNAVRLDGSLDRPQFQIPDSSRSRTTGSTARSSRWRRAVYREIAPALTPSARTLAERLGRFVASTTKKLAVRITAAVMRPTTR